MKLPGKKTQTAVPSDPGSVCAAARRNRKKLILCLVAVTAAAALVLTFLPNWGSGRAGSNGAVQYLHATVGNRDLIATLTDSGALEPADSYTVISLVSGEILSAAFETGDTVAKDDVLYQVDASDTSTNIERAENALEQRRRSYNKILESRDDLIVTAPITGTISGFQTQLGTKVNNGSVLAVIEDTGTLLLTEYYSDEYADRIYPGMPATISVSDQMLTLPGSVKEIHSLKRISETGVSCFAVTVQVKNPGSLTVGTTATCWLDGAQGEIFPTITDQDGFGANDRKVITAGISGTAEKVNVRNGEIISKGEILLEMSSDTLDDEITNAKDSLRDAELTLENQYDILSNYTIEAPIDGTIVDKYYKEGENAESGRTLCTIFDLSCLTVTLNIDELDIRSVAVGQKAQVTCDSVPDAVYEGRITEVSINGTTSGGVTTYPVKVQIDQTDGLLPGMSADIAIIISQKPNALAIPAAAVQAGSRVLVKTDDGSTGAGAPEGYDYVKVELGTSDEDYVEILSGLEPGDEIAWLPEGPANSSLEMMMGMGMAGMGGQMGGMPSGSQMGPGRPGTQTGGMPGGR